MFKSIVPSATTAILSLVALSALGDTSYDFTILAQHGQTVAGQTLYFPGNAVFNDHGEVLFTALVGTGWNQTLQTYRTSFAPSAGPTPIPGIGSSPQLDNRGTILGGCAAGLCTQAGTLVNRGATIAGKAIEYFDSWEMSRNGRIVFIATWGRRLPDSTDLIQYGLFTPTALLVKTCEFDVHFPTGCYAGGEQGSFLEGKQLFNMGLPVINNSGEIAFMCSFAPAQNGICTTSNVVDYSGSVIGGHTLTSLVVPRLNDAGTLLFLGNFNPNNNGLFTPSQELVGTGDEVEGFQFVFVGSGSMNDAGELVFIGEYLTQPGGTLLASGAFTVSGGGRRKRGEARGGDVVLKAGDQVAGQTVTQVIDVAINARGDILINAALTNGGPIIAARKHGAPHE